MMLDWMYANKDWLFSGIGATLLTAVFAVFNWLRNGRSRRGRPLDSRHSTSPQSLETTANRRFVAVDPLGEMIVAGRSAHASQPYCSFCRRGETSAGKLLTMSGSYICATCVKAGATALDNHGDRKTLVNDLSELTFLLHGQNLDAQLREEYKKRVREYSMAARKTKHDSAGDIVAGGRLIRPVGAGSFATVWEAESLRKTSSPSSRIIAVKIFDQDKLAQGLMLWRFHRGIRAMRLFSGMGLKTPSSIVKLVDVADDMLSFSMEYLPGGDLHDLERRGLSLERRLMLFRQVAEAVHFAHRQGVIHRDIKPANIVLRQDGRAVLTDFDISDLSFAATSSIYASSLGSPMFAAPEQLADARISAQPSADVYSLGKLLYFLVMQKPPPMGSTEQGHVPTYLREIRPVALQGGIHAALYAHPQDRPQTVPEFLKILGIDLHDD